MKKCFLLLIFMLFATVTIAQTQYGYVKTKGRLDDNGGLIPGQGLKGASVQIKGMTSLVVRADDGLFSFPLSDKHYNIESVQKKGYQLVDADICHKTYNYSSTPIDILMEIPEKQKEDYIKDFNRINASQQAMIDNLRKEVKRLKNQNKINEEEYNRRLDEITYRQLESQKLVSEMAERYSKMDFDRLDDFKRKISWLILNGELIKADSLIKSKGNMAKRSSDLDQLHKANVEVRADLEKSELYEAKMLEDFATDCYNLYEICMLRYENDSAFYWLELRASKDTVNIEWQLEAGAFAEIYLADYSKALAYFSLAVRQSEFRGQNDWIATCYNSVGTLYAKQSNFNKALEYYERALEIGNSALVDDPLEKAQCYNNIGAIYDIQGYYEKALEYYGEALTVLEPVLGERHLVIAQTYFNFGIVYSKLGECPIALEYYENALEIFKSLCGEDIPAVATIYNNIGEVLYRQGLYDIALEYYGKAVTIQKSALGESHPDVALSYDNIGAVYTNKGYYGEALEYLEKAKGIYKSVYSDENHLEFAQCYNKIGVVYSYQENFVKALEYHEKALAIRKTILDKDHPDIAESYSNIGSVYAGLGDYDKALLYYEWALDIYIPLLGENHSSVIIIKENIEYVKRMKR